MSSSWAGAASADLRQDAPSQNAPLRLVDQFAGASLGLAFTGDHLYFGEGLRLVAAEVTSSIEFTIVHRSDPLPGVVHILDADDDHLAIAESWQHFMVFDLSDPTRPTPIGNAQLSGTPSDAALVGQDILVVPMRDTGDQHPEAYRIGPDGLVKLDTQQFADSTLGRVVGGSSEWFATDWRANHLKRLRVAGNEVVSNGQLELGCAAVDVAATDTHVAAICHEELVVFPIQAAGKIGEPTRLDVSEIMPEVHRPLLGRVALNGATIYVSNAESNWRPYDHVPLIQPVVAVLSISSDGGVEDDVVVWPGIKVEEMILSDGLIAILDANRMIRLGPSGELPEGTFLSGIPRSVTALNGRVVLASGELTTVVDPDDPDLPELAIPSRGGDVTHVFSHDNSLLVMENDHVEELYGTRVFAANPDGAFVERSTLDVVGAAYSSYGDLGYLGYSRWLEVLRRDSSDGSLDSVHTVDVETRDVIALEDGVLLRGGERGYLPLAGVCRVRVHRSQTPDVVGCVGMGQNVSSLLRIEDQFLAIAGDRIMLLDWDGELVRGVASTRRWPVPGGGPMTAVGNRVYVAHQRSIAAVDIVDNQFYPVGTYTIPGGFGSVVADLVAHNGQLLAAARHGGVLVLEELPVMPLPTVPTVPTATTAPYPGPPRPTAPPPTVTPSPTASPRPSPTYTLGPTITPTEIAGHGDGEIFLPLVMSRW